MRAATSPDGRGASGASGGGAHQTGARLPQVPRPYSPGSVRDADRLLSDVLSEFAHTLVTDFPVQAILNHLVVRIVEVLPITGAGVTLITPGADPRFIAASDESALRYERLQTSLAEGPCLLAYETGDAVSVPDLREDDRFPVFAAQALDAGLAAVFTFPLRLGDDLGGALDLYSSETGPLDVSAMRAAQTLADVAAAYLLNARARTALRESSEHARSLALHDALTGLPNRALLVERLERTIVRCGDRSHQAAVLYADLDQFKAVNDAYGHHVGDELLVAVADRLTSLLRAGDTLARISGDEFVILYEDLVDEAEAEELAARVGAVLGRAFALSSGDVAVSASVGISYIGAGDRGPEDVLRDADTAMYQAKRRGGARHGVVDVSELLREKAQASLSRDLRGALSRGELSVAYQPIVETLGGRVVGAEALLRWKHPMLGMIPPPTAVHLAEQSGLISEIGRWVLDLACRDRHTWARHGPDRRFGVSVNVSVHQLMAPGFVGIVDEVLTATGTDPARLTLEITESVFIHDGERALAVLTDLKALGVLLALDDFGTGFSALSYLKRFPVDVVKIDQSFVADLEHDRTSRLIVRAIVGLAHGLGMTVVAEGVETTLQHERVFALGCDTSQGYLFARPTSARAVADLIGARARSDDESPSTGR